MTLYYEEYGDKGAPLMIFLHGGGVSGWMWEKQLQHFAHYHCLVPDLPEQGQSSRNTLFSIATSAELVGELIEEKANGKQVIVVGFSLGAQVAVQLLSIKSVDYAIINSALVRPVPLAGKLIRPVLRLSFPLTRSRLFSKLQAKTLYVNQDHFERYYQESSQMKLETLGRILTENMSFTIPERYKAAKGKILVTVGEKERGVMKNSAADLVRRNPNCTGLILKGIGHGVSLAQPDFFNQMIEAWLSDGSLPEEGQVIKLNYSNQFHKG